MMPTLTKQKIDEIYNSYEVGDRYKNPNSTLFFGTYNNNEPVKRFMMSIKYHDDIKRLNIMIEISFSFEDGVWFATNDDYEIFANGLTLEEAKMDFYSLLYETYQQYNDDDETTLSKDALAMKKKFTSLFDNES